MFKKILVVLISAILIIGVNANERKASREKNFILKLYKQGYYQEVINSFENFEKIYSKYMDESLFLAKAESMYNLKDYDGAIEAYKKCDEISEKYSRYCNYSIGFSYMELKQYIKALGFFKDLADSKGTYSVKSMLNTARIYNKLMQIKEAAKYYEIYIENEKPTVQVVMEYADTLFSQEREDEAIDILNEISKKNKESVPIKEKLAYYNRKIGNNSKALELYRELQKISDQEKYKFYAGTIFFNDSKYEEAINNFEALIKSKQFGEQAYFYIAQSHYLLLDFQKAIDSFKNLMESENKQMRNKSLYFMAASYYQLKEYDKALEIIDQNKDKDIELLEIKRDILISTGKFKEAIEVIRDLISYENNLAYNYYLAGQCYYNLQNFDRALANLELAEKKSEDEKIKYSAIFEKAGIYMIKGDRKKSLEEYNKIPVNSSLFKEATFKIVDLYRTEKNYDKIFELLEELQKTDAENSYIFYTKAELYFEQGKKESALKELDKIKKQDTHYWKSILLKSNILISDNQLDKAKSILLDNFKKAPSEFKTELIFKYAEVNFELQEYDIVISSIEELLKDKEKQDFKLNDEIRLILAKAYLNIKNFAQAEANAMYVAEETDDPEIQIKAQYMLGSIYFDFENYKQAVLEFLKCALLDNKSNFAAKAYFRSAECYQKLKRYEDAVKTYKRVIDNYDDNMLEDIAKKRIEKIEEDFEPAVF